jgi:hypothetical protein
LTICRSTDWILHPMVALHDKLGRGAAAGEWSIITCARRLVYEDDRGVAVPGVGIPGCSRPLHNLARPIFVEERHGPCVHFHSRTSISEFTCMKMALFSSSLSVNTSSTGSRRKSTHAHGECQSRKYGARGIGGEPRVRVQLKGAPKARPPLSFLSRDQM